MTDSTIDRPGKTQLETQPDGYGLLAPQAATWFDQRFFPDKPVYITGQAIVIAAALDLDRFRQALSRAVAEHDALRLRFWLDGGAVRQAPRPPAPVALEVLDLSGEADPMAAARQWMDLEIRVPIAWDGDPLYRFALLRLGPDRSVWFQKFHHLLIDATGRQLLTARVAALYGGGTSPSSAVPFAEAKQIEDAYLASRRFAADRAHWIERFASLPEPLVEADRRQTERARSGRPSRVGFTLPRADFDRLAAAAAALDATVFKALLTLVCIAYARLTDKPDLVMGIPLNNRTGARFRQAIGLYAQNMPCRVALDLDASVAETMRRIDRTLTRDYPHRRFPIHEIHAALGLAQKGRAGLFDVLVNYLSTDYSFEFAGAPVELINLSYGFPVAWMVIVVDPGPGRDVEVAIDYDRGLIETAEAECLRDALRALLVHGLDDPSVPVGRLRLMDAAAEAQVRHWSTGEAVALPAHATLASLCAEQAARTPRAVALICGTEQVDHATLQARAEHLARRLRAMGAATDVPIGLALPRTVELIVAVLAVHKAGAAYLPLDPAYPAERIAYIIADSAAPVILTTTAIAPSLPATAARVIALDAPGGDPPTPDVALPPPRPEHLAYVLYTSGSTGRPKAVGVEHRNAVNLITWGRGLADDTDLSGLLLATSMNFDLSVFEIFLPLAFGGRIVLVDNLLALPAAPARDAVRLVNTGPSLLDALLRTGGLPPDVRTIVLAGEALPRGLADRLFAVAPTVRLINAYGPTETTVYASASRVEPGDPRPPPIGRPLPNTTLQVLDPQGVPRPPGVPGELFIGGANVARGYLNRPELTAERFVPDPMSKGRAYRTGDRVRWRADGELDFLGRVDNQVKINGLRVEPGEIEAALLANPAVAGAAVVLRQDRGGTPRLAAFLAARDPAAQPSSEQVRRELERSLPRHMVPTVFQWVAGLPLTPNGKLDRKALVLPDDAAPPSVGRGPESWLERDLLAIWQTVLRNPAIGCDDDFFDLGGDSLAAVNLLMEIERRFGVDMTADLLAGGITVARLAQHLGGAYADQSGSPLVALQPLGDKPPFFCVHGIGGEVVVLHPLARAMAPDRPFIGIRDRGVDDTTERRIDDMAARYVAAMLQRQPSGPFLLGGYSLGGTIAYEMAQQLTHAGHRVALLAIIDARRPDWRPTWREALPVCWNFLHNLPRWVRADLLAGGLDQVWRNIARKLAGWGSADSDPRRVIDVSRYTPEQQAAIRRNFAAARAYRVLPYAGKVTLLRSHTQPLLRPQARPSMGWETVAQGGVEVREVPGNHVSFVNEPMVHHLARALRSCIDRID